MVQKVFALLCMAVLLFGDMTAYESSKVECVVLEAENSIICKFTQKRVNKDKNIRFEWIEPNGKITRTREMIIPAGHGSVYDYRYIKGRTKGIWEFRAIDEESQYSTNFEIK